MAEHKHWRNYTDLKYLRAEVFMPGEKKVLTIKDVKMEHIIGDSGKEDTKPVLYFEENMLPMVANATNCKTIKALYGTDFMDEWVGKKIQVIATRTKVGREMVPCIRIEKVIPASNVPEYHCSVCNKTITKDIYEKSTAKYGKAYCSGECLEKDTKGEQLLQ
jgi:hypothetical protein